MANVFERIEKFNAPLLPDMVKLKYEAMAENVYRFYRGTCHLFYEDLSKKLDQIPNSPIAWLCGDLHLENFGSYKADNKLVYFDLDDFDESILAPAIWELTRMLTSIFIAFDNLELGQEKAHNMARMFLKSYSTTLTKGKAISIDPRTAQGIVCDFLTSAAKRKQKDLLRKRTELKKKTLVLTAKHEKQLELDKHLKKELAQHINSWIANSNDGPYNFEVINSIFRVAGTGSIGVKRYLFLLKSINTENKYLLLDMKEARPSSLQPYVKFKQPKWSSHAERVISVQQRMQNTLPALLGNTLFKGDSYVLQQMQPMEDSINFELIKDRYRDIYQVIDDMAVLTASAQLRSSGRQGSAIADDLIAFGERNNWQDKLLKYATGYAKQTKKDYKEFVSALKRNNA